MKYTKVRATANEEIQMNAGVLLSAFEPSTGAVTPANILAATTGGLSFSAVPSFLDFGDDIDNLPKNTMEMKKIDDVEVKLSGTFLTVTASIAKMLAGAADTESVTSQTLNVSKITPRKNLVEADFQDFWAVGDYGDVDGGYIAIHVMNGLSTGGFSLQTTDKGKGQMAVEITGHYSIDEQDVVPYEIYIAKPSA